MTEESYARSTSPPRTRRVWRSTTGSPGSRRRPSRRCPRRFRRTETRRRAARGRARTRRPGSPAPPRRHARGKRRSERGCEVEPARADVLQHRRESNCRVLRSVQRPGEPLLLPDQLEGIEVEPLTLGGQADDHGGAAVPRGAERSRGRGGVPHRVEAVVGAVGELGPHHVAKRVRDSDVRGSRTRAASSLASTGSHDDDRLGARDPRALDDELPDTARPDHEHGGARLDPRRVEHAPTPVSTAQPRSAAWSKGTAPASGSATCSWTTTRSARHPVAVPR